MRDVTRGVSSLYSRRDDLGQGTQFLVRPLIDALGAEQCLRATQKHHAILKMPIGNPVRMPPAGVRVVVNPRMKR